VISTILVHHFTTAEMASFSLLSTLDKARCTTVVPEELQLESGIIERWFKVLIDGVGADLRTQHGLPFNLGSAAN
jgi:hypothetical protein